MPIYEYECPKCGTEFEDWGKASDSHKEVPCPKCGTPSPRMISRTSFVLKGDGWYVSDYGYRKGISEDGDSGGKVPAVSTDNKPAIKSGGVPAKSAEKASPPPKAEPAPKPGADAKKKA